MFSIIKMNPTRPKKKRTAKVMRQLSSVDFFGGCSGSSMFPPLKKIYSSFCMFPPIVIVVSIELK
jgi:hypothetical protein